MLQLQSIIAEATQECGTKAKSDKLFAKVTLARTTMETQLQLKEGNLPILPLSSLRIRKIQDFLLEPMKNQQKKPCFKAVTLQISSVFM